MIHIYPEILISFLFYNSWSNIHSASSSWPRLRIEVVEYDNVCPLTEMWPCLRISILYLFISVCYSPEMLTWSCWTCWSVRQDVVVRSAVPRAMSLNGRAVMEIYFDFVASYPIDIILEKASFPVPYWCIAFKYRRDMRRRERYRMWDKGDKEGHIKRGLYGEIH